MKILIKTIITILILSGCSDNTNSVRINGGKVRMYYTESLDSTIPHLIKFNQPAEQLWDWHDDFVIIGISLELEKYFDPDTEENERCRIHDSLVSINAHWTNNINSEKDMYFGHQISAFPSEKLTMDESIHKSQKLSLSQEDPDLITPYIYANLNDFISSYNLRGEQIQNCELNHEFYFYLNTYKINPPVKVGTISLELNFNNRTVELQGLR